jgi:HEPN domain-containing protein
MDRETLIKFLLDQADDDLGAANALLEAGYYAQSLFWGHLVLEKLLKALWIYHNNDINYPHIHNLLRLLKECNTDPNDKQIIFLAEMNQFQATGRYGDTLLKLESTISKETCNSLFSEIENQMIWIKSQMEKK